MAIFKYARKAVLLFVNVGTIPFVNTNSYNTGDNMNFVEALMRPVIFIKWRSVGVAVTSTN
jgi:hypothetical protein